MQSSISDITQFGLCLAAIYLSVASFYFGNKSFKFNLIPLRTVDLSSVAINQMHSRDFLNGIENSDLDLSLRHENRVLNGF